MVTPLAALSASRSGWFDLGAFAIGVVLFVYAALDVVSTGFESSVPALISIPLVVVIAKFPMVLDRGEGSIEVGFESSVLMFLLCTLDAQEALVLWSSSVLITQLTSGRRPIAKAFNIGVGVIGGSVAAGVFHAVRGDAVGAPRELLAVALAAACYFASDFLLSATSVAVETGTALREHPVQRGTWLATACLVPFDSLGYLAAVIVRLAPPWTLLLLVVPLMTLLVATRAVTRGGENSRRLGVLLDAAVRAQASSDTRQIVEALVEDARRLLRITQIDVRDTPPGREEVGAQLHDDQEDRWIVAQARQRARSTSTADEQALQAMVAVSSDSLARLRLTDDMTHLARHDLLTNLPNRRLLVDRIEHALTVSRRHGTRTALLFVDLDGFKPVNDRFGHTAGDTVLVDVAERLVGCVRASDTVARIGGDEFALLLDDVDPVAVTSACERIFDALSPGVLVAGHVVPLAASVGVAVGDPTETAESMLRNSDLAMYEAKARGKNQWVQYEPAIGQARLQRLELVESLRTSVAAEDLTLLYQPVVNVSTGRITGVEALARWKSDGVHVSPDVFIRLAEETGLIVALGDVVLNKAARDAPAMMRAAGDQISVSVNISAQQLSEPDFVGKVERAKARMGGAGLVLEITERDVIGDDQASMTAMTTLAERGVPFAIDDFGVGFSSIGYLQDMPVQIIKTDLSFSRSIDQDERSCALLCSITMMGQALGLDVVVEGIERTSQLDHLRKHAHASFAQGYLMHRPMPLDQLLSVLADNRAPDARPQVPAGSDVDPIARQGRGGRHYPSLDPRTT
jgi:diguanylate cyclase (GGDEF)-like protein